MQVNFGRITAQTSSDNLFTLQISFCEPFNLNNYWATQLTETIELS